MQSSGREPGERVETPAGICMLRCCRRRLHREMAQAATGRSVGRELVLLAVRVPACVVEGALLSLTHPHSLTLTHSHSLLTTTEAEVGHVAVPPPVAS